MTYPKKFQRNFLGDSAAINFFLCPAVRWVVFFENNEDGTLQTSNKWEWTKQITEDFHKKKYKIEKIQTMSYK